MEQVNNAALAMLQTIASQAQMSQTTKTAKSDVDSDFQKLMDKAASSASTGAGKDAQVDDTAQAEAPAASKTEEAPVQQEDALTRIKKMLEQNGDAVAFKPGWPCYCIDLNTGETTAVYNPGEYVMVYTGEDFEVVPTIDLEPWQQAQLDQLLIDPNPIDVSDPRADALLEATAPGADNSPAAMLEKVVADQFGKVVNQTVEKAAVPDKPEQTVEEIQVEVEAKDDDVQVEVSDGSQVAPQRLFHDVQAAPVKVGEVYDASEAEEPNVAQQIDAGLAQALEKGDSMVRIQLTPENLGSVTIEITQSTQGIIHVALNAHSSETRGLLERHAGELQGMLTSRTQQSVEVDVQRQQESQQGQNQQNYDGRNGHAQDGQGRRRQHHEQASSQDFMQQLRLGLIPIDGDEA